MPITSLLELPCGRDQAVDAGAATHIDDSVAGFSSPRLKGFPVPAKDSIDNSGTLSSHSSGYPSSRASGRPVWKWKPCSGSSATSLVLILNGETQRFQVDT
jgi:hypothetical protein